MSKKNILIISMAYVVLFVALFFVSEFCKLNWCRIHDDDFLGILLLTFLPLFPVFLLSLITYKMRDEVFQAWWKFARWFVPVIMLVTFLLNSQSRGGGMSATISGGFDIMIISLFYIIFVITSLVKIGVAYRQIR